MASPSTSSPSEGEIVESDLEKATTAITSDKGNNVDRPFRTRITVSRSPSPIRSPKRQKSRTASRSPYRENRSGKRVHDEDHYDRAREDPRRFKVRYEDHPESGKSRAREPYPVDRSSGRDKSHYNNDQHTNGRPREKRPRLRSRSPINSKPYRMDNGHLVAKNQGDRGSREQRHGQNNRRYDESRSRLSREQSVSDRGHSPVAAARMKQEAESQKTQTQHTDNLAGYPGHATANPVLDDGVEESTPPFNAQPIDEASRIEERRKRREAIKARHRGQATPMLVQALAINNSSAPPTPNQDNADGIAQTIKSAQKPSPTATKETSGQESPNDLVILKYADLANSTATAPGFMQEDEPSAADYDPTMDMQEDKLRHDHHQRKDEVSSGAYDETTAMDQAVLLPIDQNDEPSENKTDDAFDMFAENDELDMFAEAPTGSKQPEKEATKAVPIPQAKALDMSMLDDWDDPEGYYKVILGELLDSRYHIQSNLGKGMFSGVVRAMDQRDKNLVAIKVIRNNETMKKAGLKEIEILQKLSSADPEDKKHLIRLERYFEHKGHLCMVFENLSINLREVLKKFGRDVGINLKAVRAYGQQMFLALSLLRKVNILHADLKPDNMLVNEARNVLKICDLGSASDASENEITQYLVSRFYRAPEIILGMDYDFGIDIWSIGCTLFEMYTGKILFTGRSNNQMLRAIMECRGKFSHKILRKAQFAGLHFDDLLNFRSLETDKVSGRDVVRILNFTKSTPARDLKSRLMANAKGMSDAEIKELQSFVDLLERCLNLNPEKRCTPAEALRHPFITRVKA